MTILYLFLSLFASQLFLATPSVIREEQIGNKAKPPASDVNKTESESTDRDTPPFLLTTKHNIMRGIKGHVKGPLLQAESPGDAKAEAHYNEREVDACRKVDMMVNPADLGLPGIVIAPDVFNAYQCKGKCAPPQPNSVNYSKLKAWIEKNKGIKADGKACCVPTKLAPVSFLVFNENQNVVLKTFDDTIAEECGCY